jgi:hypothetical protein
MCKDRCYHKISITALNFKFDYYFITWIWNLYQSAVCFLVFQSFKQIRDCRNLTRWNELWMLYYSVISMLYIAPLAPSGPPHFQLLSIIILPWSFDTLLPPYHPTSASPPTILPPSIRSLGNPWLWSPWASPNPLFFFPPYSPIAKAPPYLPHYQLPSQNCFLPSSPTSLTAFPSTPRLLL